MDVGRARTSLRKPCKQAIPPLSACAELRFRTQSKHLYEGSNVEYIPVYPSAILHRFDGPRGTLDQAAVCSECSTGLDLMHHPGDFNRASSILFYAFEILRKSPCKSKCSMPWAKPSKVGNSERRGGEDS